MSVQNDYQSQSEEYDATKAWRDGYFDFVLIEEGKPPARIELARERMLICRLYLGLLRTITDDYGAEFATHSDSLAHRTIGIYVFLRTVMCSPARASSDCPRFEVTARLGAEASARNGEARLRGKSWQRLSRHGQSKHPRPKEKA